MNAALRQMLKELALHETGRLGEHATTRVIGCRDGLAGRPSDPTPGLCAFRYRHGYTMAAAVQELVWVQRRARG